MCSASRCGIARDLDRGFLNIRRLAREYLDLGLESSADAVTKELASLRELLQRGMTEIKNPERHRLVEEVGRNAETYAQSFGQLVALRRDREKLVKETLDPLGTNLQRGFDALIAAAGKAGNGDVEVLGYKGRQQLMLTRVNVSKQLERNDKASADATQAAFVDLAAAAQALETATRGTEFQKILEELQTGLTGYRDVSGKATDINRKMDDLANGTMREMGGKVVTDTESIKASGIAEEQQEERDTLSTMASASSLILYLSIGGLVLGVVLAWLIGRGISGPVVRMCAAMRALAGGDKTVEIPGVGRKDEIGQMADTVAVFRDNMVEADRLRVETERSQGRGGSSPQDEHAASCRYVRGRHQGRGQFGRLAGHRDAVRGTVDDPHRRNGDAAGNRGGRRGGAGLGKCADGGDRGRGTIGVRPGDRPAGGSIVEDRRPGGDGGGSHQHDGRGARIARRSASARWCS